MRRLALVSAVVAVALAAGSCYEGPFAHVNPNDPDTRFTMRLESDRDTISPAQPAAQLTLITEPAMPGYAPVWRASIDTLVTHTGDGRFLLTDIPESTITILVRASFLNQAATRTLVITP